MSTQYLNKLLLHPSMAQVSNTHTRQNSFRSCPPLYFTGEGSKHFMDDSKMIEVSFSTPKHFLTDL